MAETSNLKLAVPTFLKVLTNNNVPVAKAMSVTRKIYKDYNTPNALAQLTDIKLKAAGVDDKEDRKAVLVALRKAGYAPVKRTAKDTSDVNAQGRSDTGTRASTSTIASAGTSTPKKDSATPWPSSFTPPLNAVQKITTPISKRKRKRDRGDLEVNELLPSAPADEGAAYGSLEFNEVLDVNILKSKMTLVNRAPLMTAWATVVAERLGFQREEALSIANVYTELNAISKGMSLGIYDEDKNNGREASRGGSQPYVELMGRRPLYKTQSSEWRALSSNSPAPPLTAFSYISRAFRQTTPFVIGALRLLAQSFAPAELNRIGFALYADFRPTVEGWGARGEVRCERILALRKDGYRDEYSDIGSKEGVGVEDIVKVDRISDPKQAEDGNETAEVQEPDRKRSRGLSLEEYEAALDAEPTFEDVDLANLP